MVPDYNLSNYISRTVEGSNTFGTIRSAASERDHSSAKAHHMYQVFEGVHLQ